MRASIRLVMAVVVTFAALLFSATVLSSVFDAPVGSSELLLLLLPCGWLGAVSTRFVTRDPSEELSAVE